MVFSRRHVLAVAAGMPLAFGQAPADSFAVASGSGLRMERFGDPQRPAVALFLPETKSPSAIIEMPEHAAALGPAGILQAMGMRNLPDVSKLQTGQKTLRAETIEIAGQKYDCWVVESR